MRRVLAVTALSLVLLVAGYAFLTARQAGRESGQLFAWPRACCPHHEEPQFGTMVLRVQGGPPVTFSREYEIWPEPVVVHPGDGVEVELGWEVPVRLHPTLALGLAGGEGETQLLSGFDDHGRTRFTVPPDLAPGEYRLVLGEPTFAAYGIVDHIDLQVVAAP